MRNARTLLGASALVAAVALTAVGSPVGARAAGAGSDRFLAGQPYTGPFPDPTVLVDNGRYVLSGTTTANLNLPILTSTDLVTFTPREPLPDWSSYSNWAMYNEAMTTAPAWAAVRGHRGPVDLVSQWAPSLAKVGGQYVAAYSAAVTLQPRHSCIGVAVASSPLGPYTHPSSRPLVCQPAAALGAIDPDVFVDRDGTPYLLWKNEGVKDKLPPRLMARKLAADGTRFASGSTARVLATRGRSWEGSVVENPSMVRYKGSYWLFYSGNAWATSRYAVGYARCKTPLGPCTKSKADRPLLKSFTGVSGPGGADAFRDTAGRLRFVYAAWDAGRVGGANPRRLHVATVTVLEKGKLKVTSRG